MKHYRVAWMIDLEAENPQEAAMQALAIHRDPDSIATYFHVRDVDTQECIDVDVTPRGAHSAGMT